MIRTIPRDAECLTAVQDARALPHVREIRRKSMVTMHVHSAMVTGIATIIAESAVQSTEKMSEERLFLIMHADVSGKVMHMMTVMIIMVKEGVMQIPTAAVREDEAEGMRTD